MNHREQLVAALVGVVIAGLVAWYGVYWYFEQLDVKERKLQVASSEVKKKQAEQRNAQLASKRLASYEERSLPADEKLAKSLYENWLLQVASEVKPELALKVTAKAPSPPVKNTFSRLSFSISTQGELPQVVEFLYRIQRVDWLHRIDTLTLTPLNDSRKIDMVLNISALSVRNAPHSTELAEVVGEKYKSTTLADYLDPIINRNFFGAPNRQPQLDLAARSDAFLDRTFEHTLKASDPDGLDQLSYALVKSADPAAKLDPKTGKFTWRPKTKGEFAFEIAAKDDGIPNQSSIKKMLITVKDPPPPKVEVAAPKKPAFDDAKYTVLTAVIDKTGVGEIWLNLRTKGETRILQVGDEFQIGSVKGEVSEIGVDDVLLLIDGKLRRLVVGQTLALSDTND